MRYNKDDQVQVFAKGKLIKIFDAPFTMCDSVAKRIAIMEYKVLEGTDYSDFDINVM